VSAAASNVSLGFMLGMLPALSKALGLPIDVRHITFSAGRVTLAAAHFGWAVFLRPEMYFALLGLFLVGMLNFTVSFALALAVAIRASLVRPRKALGLWQAIGLRLRESPREFFLPPPESSRGVVDEGATHEGPLIPGAKRL
jgi:site-specific recombinase